MRYVLKTKPARWWAAILASRILLVEGEEGDGPDDIYRAAFGRGATNPSLVRDLGHLPRHAADAALADLATEREKLKVVCAGCRRVWWQEEDSRCPTCLLPAGEARVGGEHRRRKGLALHVPFPWKGARMFIEPAEGGAFLAFTEGKPMMPVGLIFGDSVMVLDESKWTVYELPELKDRLREVRDWLKTLGWVRW